MKQSRRTRRKKLKLLDVNSDEAIEDTGIPDEEKLEQSASRQKLDCCIAISSSTWSAH
ncbi:MAG: hypothetical protein ACLU77_00045 [Waltera sp.]